MCSGRKTFGKSTTFGSGNTGIVTGSMSTGDCRRQNALQSSMDRSGFLIHVVHEDVAAERARGCEVRLAVADLGDLPDEADEIVVAREHERIDQDPGLAAGGDLGKRLRHDE